MSDDPEYPPELRIGAATLASNPATLIVLEWILDRCDVSGRSGSEYREGQRNVGRQIHDLLDAADPGIAVNLATRRAAARMKARVAGDADADE